jgi:hypothetical protein
MFHKNSEKVVLLVINEAALSILLSKINVNDFI